MGLYYYGARYYDPAIGRFTRQDSYRGKLKKPQTQHLYIYVLNNPLKLTDPTGNKYKIGGSDPVYGKSMYNNKVEEGLVDVGASATGIHFGVQGKTNLNKLAIGRGLKEGEANFTGHINPEIGASFDIEIGEGDLETVISPTKTKHLGIGILWEKNKKGKTEFGGVAFHLGAGFGLDLLPFDITSTISE